MLVKEAEVCSARLRSHARQGSGGMLGKVTGSFFCTNGCIVCKNAVPPREALIEDRRLPSCCPYPTGLPEPNVSVERGTEGRGACVAISDTGIVSFLFFKTSLLHFLMLSYVFLYLPMMCIVICLCMSVLQM
jgi:hypothetical protein